MDDTIISRDLMRARGRRAFDEGKGRDDHGMNTGSAAIPDWQDGWDRAYADWAHPEEAAA